jgi:CheY-like chemotaxis protein
VPLPASLPAHHPYARGRDVASPPTLTSLVTAQLAGIDALLERAKLPVLPGLSEPLSREQRLDRSRREDAVAREVQALQDWTAEQLASPCGPPGTEVRAVLAHRNVWVRTKVRDVLVSYGVDVVAEVTDGACASAVVAAEQPDVLLVEDRLPFFDGLHVLERVRDLSATRITVQVMDSAQMHDYLDAGASAVFAWGTRPAEAADLLLGRVGADARPAADLAVGA